MGKDLAMTDPLFDVFLSYYSEDVGMVERLAIALEDTVGLRPWLDKWQLIPGEPWQRELERGLTSSRACAVFVGPSGRGPWQRREVDAALSTQVEGGREFRVIPVLLPGAPGDVPDLPLFLTGHTWVRFESLDDEDAWWQLQCGIEGRSPGRGPVPRRARTSKEAPTREKATVGEVGVVATASEARHVFLCHYPQEPDRSLGHAFDEALKQAGHEVFTDTGTQQGAQWAKQVREALEKADYLVILLSKEAAVSEEVAEKVELAREIAEGRNSPVVLAVRLHYPLSEPLPYLLSVHLRQIREESWDSPSDNGRVLDFLLEQISEGVGRTAVSGQTAVSGVRATGPFRPRSPAPYLDPRPYPGGAIDVQARYYVLRQADEDVVSTVRRPREVATVRGSRQSGKTSLILRTQAAVEQAHGELKAVFVDFQALPRGDFESLDTLWHAIAEYVARRVERIGSYELSWDEGKRYDRNFERFLDSVFRGSETRLLLCLDETDRVFRFEISSEFFASVRAFYNRGAHDPTWKRVSWLLGTSSEPAFFVEDFAQSPFNIGFRAELAPFTETQIADFAGRFGMSADLADPARIRSYVGGQPYLVHLVLHHLARGELSAEAIFDATTAANTVFREHLLRFLLHFQKDKPLAQAMKWVIEGKDCDDARLADRLEGAGLIRRGDEGKLVPLCELYTEFFRKEL